MCRSASFTFHTVIHFVDVASFLKIPFPPYPSALNLGNKFPPLIPQNVQGTGYHGRQNL